MDKADSGVDAVRASQPVLKRKIQDSPSLRRFLVDELQSIYLQAIRGAVFETGVEAVELPQNCPFTPDQLMESFDPDWPR
jgi:hypothetical protein